MDRELLFVYGTLRRGSRHEMVEFLERSSRFVDEAVFQGRLFMVASYPGCVPSDDPRDRVVGEVYGLQSASTVLCRLDAYEGYDPRNADGPYVRSAEIVTLGTGECVEAWIYLYNRPTDELAPIPSGDFLQSLR